MSPFPRTTRPLRRGTTALVAVTAVAMAAAGCSRVDNLRPTAAGADRYQLTASFSDALNLPDGATVKVDGVQVGKVVKIEPDDYRARVTMAIDDDIEIPSTSRFRLRYTTALGEVYVEITPSGEGELLAEGDTVDDASTAVAPSVEDALASASLLVNGGNLGQIQTIVSELNTALDGRVGATQSLLEQTDIFLAEALASTQEIDRVLDALSAASATLDAREETINAALRDLRPAAQTLTENTDDLAALLRSADALAITADDLVVRTREDLVLIVDELGPVLDTVLAAEGELLPALDDLATFSATLDDRTPTDYLNLYFKLRVDSVLTSPLPGLGDLLGGSTPNGG
ncbi:MCE family protein [Nocardioides sp. ChNu-153]|uniref:MCE family protein n=1 Tax=unclassified Nocardioides TaxID=2615069 RepID=UPI0024055848|nr:MULTISPECIES: MCE family protein [unclassified Nocardioides]MDF9715389.1 MCE family protein [Nocardioides sp. ChNu-99]MDN7121794.1 MCE family protein [Nocardioides sp. ChNu-153]